MANKKAKARRRAQMQREARERRRESDRDVAARRAKTSAAREARRARNAPRVARHDAAVLPLIRELREARATWQEVADWLNDAAVSPPGGRGGDGGWSGKTVWRIARRGGIAGRLPAEEKEVAAPVELQGGRLRMPDGRIVRPYGPRDGVVAHDALVLPTIRTMRAQGASWRTIADRLEADGVMSPGKRDAHIRARGWTATAVWRIGRRHGLL